MKRRIPTTAGLVCAIGVVVALLWATSQSGHEGGVLKAQQPGGFVSEIILDSIPRPMDLAFAPDGRVFIATLHGHVRIVKDGELLSQVFHAVPVNSRGERGLMSIALDPDFTSNGYVYLYYTVENNAADPQGPKTGRLIRVTADGDMALAGSEVILMGTEGGRPEQPSCEDFPIGTDCIPADGLSHVGGGLRFAPDGKLLLATGDAAFAAPSHDELIKRSQDLDSLAGKLLRINPDGSAPNDNPFYTGDPSANRSKVWAYGLRQPFRMGIDPDTGLPFIGEVGSRYWEEINIGASGQDYGWPCYEGYTQHPTQSDLVFCQLYYASGTIPEEPLHAYSRSPGAAVIGGDFAQSSTYPEQFQDVYFYGDWVRHEIYTLAVDVNGELLPGSGEVLMSDASAPTAFARGPDGDIYYLTWPRVTSFGELRRVSFTDADQPPRARASASPMGGLAPLTVQFTSDESFDPEGEDLAFFWDFADGNTSTAANPVHTFNTNGTYDVVLTVTDPASLSDTATVRIIVGNGPPKATITTPQHRATYEAWDIIAFSGSGWDPELGEISPTNMKWTIILHHCEPATAGCHTHPFIEMTGREGTLMAPDQADELLFLELNLTVTDAVGLTDTHQIFIGPDTDGDGLLDFEELLIFGTDYLNPDSSGNGILDGDEDADNDGCSNARELGNDPSVGGQRDPFNPWDFYDVNGDQVVDLSNDILGVILHYSPGGYTPGTPAVTGFPGTYDDYDRGPSTGPYPWNMTAPDGRIDLSNDILGVIAQYGHDCR